MGIKLFVGSLPLSLNEKNLKKTFKIYGAVLSVLIATDSHTGRSRGFGYVEMKSQTAARNAINALNGAELNGRNIFVEQAHLSD